MASNLARNLIPLFDRVLIKRAAPAQKTSSGILLPESQRMNEGTVVSVGKGARRGDKYIPPQLKEGDKVLLPEYGGTKVKLEDQELFLFREDEILGLFH